MASSVGYILAQLQRWTSPRLDELSDVVLLERFVQQHDESAFAALVARHGGMVLHSCHRVLGDAHEAEDAFQATFLILARRAYTLRQPAALPGFLHSVARRVALKARAKAAGYAGKTPLAEELPDAHSDPLMQLTVRELLTVLDEEVARLPAAQRSAVVLCCLEGHTREEAARILGCTAGSLKGHLERGRQRLQKRLERRGITLPAALALVAVSRGEAAPVLLLQNTVKAALHGGIGSGVSALAHSVLKAMLLGKLAGAIGVTLTLTLAAATTVALAYRGAIAEIPEDKTPPSPAARKDADAGKPRVRTDAFGDPLPDGAIRRLGTLRFRHGGGIHNLLPTPDGKTLVSNDYYGTRTVCVWELATGRLLHRFPGTYFAKNIALSPDGKLVAITQEKAIHLWDLVSGKEVRRLAQADASGVAFSADSKILAANGGLGMKLWDLAAGKKIAQLDHKRDDPDFAPFAFTPDGRTLIAGQEFHSKIGLWDVASGKKRQELDARVGASFSFALSPDGVLLATGSRQDGIPLWDVKSGKLVHKLGRKGSVLWHCVAFAPDGKTLAAVERDAKNNESIVLWDAATGKERKRFENEIGIWAMCYSGDGRTLIVASVNAIHLRDTATGKDVGPTAGSPGYARFATLTPGGRTLAYLGDHEIRFWDVQVSREIGAIDTGPHGTRSLVFAPDGQTVAAGTGELSINIWDVKTRKLLRRLQTDEKEKPNARGAASEVAFSPDGRVLASADAKGPTIRLWDISTGKQVRQLDLSDPHARKNDFVNPNGIAFSPDGRLLAASGRTGFGGSRVAIWEAATGKELPHLTRAINDPAQKDEPSHEPGRSDFDARTIYPKVVFSPNGGMLAKNGRPRTIAIWETATGQRRLRLKGHEDSTVCVAFAPDSRTLASASWDETIRLWDLETGRELRKLTGHRGEANSLAFSADGEVLVSCGDDTTILFWDVADVTHRKRPHSAPLAAKEWQTLWEDLAKDDAAKAYAAMIRMTTDGTRTIVALKERLHPIRPADAEPLAKLLKDLDSDDFAMREAAGRELQKLGDVVRPTIRQTLARPGSSLELRRRLEALAGSLEELSGVRLRQVRAVEVLEMLGTAEARESLKTIATGASEARLTQQAKAALEHLANVRR